MTRKQKNLKYIRLKNLIRKEGNGIFYTDQETFNGNYVDLLILKNKKIYGVTLITSQQLAIDYFMDIIDTTSKAAIPNNCYPFIVTYENGNKKYTMTDEYKNCLVARAEACKEIYNYLIQENAVYELDLSPIFEYDNGVVQNMFCIVNTSSDMNYDMILDYVANFVADEIENGIISIYLKDIDYFDYFVK